MILGEIIVDFEESLQQLFELEDKNINDRATYRIIVEKPKLRFTIEATDIVAFRACYNAISKTLQVFYQAKSV